MKEMIYKTEQKREVLDSGYCMGFSYYILSLGSHPTAYVEIPVNHILYGKYYIEIEDMGIDIDVNGGLTYSRDYLFLENGKELKGWFIGWDYNHCSDYSGLFNFRPSNELKKWTTEEIQKEVMNVCYQLKELQHKEENYE